MKIIIIGLFIHLCHQQLIRVQSYFDGIKAIQKNVDYLTVLVTSTTQSSCIHCRDAEIIYQAFTNQVEGIVKTYLIDCNKISPSELQHVQACGTKYLSKLPMVTFLTPPLNLDISNSPKENHLHGELSIASLLQAVQDYSPRFFQILESKQQFDQFLGNLIIPNKIILLMPNETIPLWFYGLSSYYRDRLDVLPLPYPYQSNGVYPDLLILRFDQITKGYVQETYKGGKRLESAKASLSRFASKDKIRTNKSQFEKPSVDDSTMQVISFDELGSILTDDNDWVMVCISKNGLIDAQISTFKDNFAGLMRYYSLTCKDQSCKKWLSQRNQDNQAPNILIYRIGKKNINNPHFVGEMDSFDITCQDLFEAIPLARGSLFHSQSERAIFTTIKESQELEGKYSVVLCLDTSDQYWLLIATTVQRLTRYSKHLNILVFENPSEESKASWQINRLPAVIGFIEINFQSGQHKRFDFNEVPSYLNLILFLDKLALQHEQTKNIEIPESINQEMFETICINTMLPCVIGLLDTSDQNQFHIGKDAIQKARNAYIINFSKQAKFRINEQNIKWTWIDINCQQSLAKRLKIYKEQPAVIFYEPAKNRYSLMAKLFNINNILMFVQAQSQSKKNFIKIDDYLDLDVQINQNYLKNDKCEQMRKAYNNNSKQLKQDL